MTDFPEQSIEELQNQIAGNQEDVAKFDAEIHDELNELATTLRILSDKIVNALSTGCAEDLVAIYDEEISRDVRTDRRPELTFDVETLLRRLKDRENAIRAIESDTAEIAERSK